MMTFKPSPEKRLVSHNREDLAEDTFKRILVNYVTNQKQLLAAPLLK